MMGNARCVMSPMFMVPNYWSVLLKAVQVWCTRTPITSDSRCISHRQIRLSSQVQRSVLVIFKISLHYETFLSHHDWTNRWSWSEERDWCLLFKCILMLVAAGYWCCSGCSSKGQIKLIKKTVDEFINCALTDYLTGLSSSWWAGRTKWDVMRLSWKVKQRVHGTSTELVH